MAAFEVQRPLEQCMYGLSAANGFPPPTVIPYCVSGLHGNVTSINEQFFGCNSLLILPFPLLSQPKTAVSPNRGAETRAVWLYVGSRRRARPVMHDTADCDLRLTISKRLYFKTNDQKSSQRSSRVKLSMKRVSPEPFQGS